MTCGNICWNPDDVYLALIGGCLIGLATSLHYILMGRVTGFSGIYYSLITFDKGSWNWKLGLMSSVMLASSLMFKILDNGQTSILKYSSPSYNNESLLTGIGWAGCIISGFLVGFGTKMGNGCTSGHGVCGLPRLSIRSFVAVCSFMGMGFITATFRYYVIGSDFNGPVMFKVSDYSYISTGFLCLSALLILLAFILQLNQDRSKLVDVTVACLTGFIFGLGLVVSGMVQRYKIVSFLTISSIWDPSLAFVMISAVGINFITFRLFDKPVFNTKYEVPKNKTVDLKLVLGSTLFGMGWGIGGLCPGPAIALYPEFTVQIGILFMVFLGIGQVCANIVVEKTKDVELMSRPLL